MARVGRIRKQRVTVAEVYARDHPDVLTPEQVRRIGNEAETITQAEGSASNVEVLRRTPSPIERLLRLGLVTKSQAGAAVQFRTDFELAGLDPLKASDWTKPVVDYGHTGTLALNEIESVNDLLDARRRASPMFRELRRQAFNAALKVLSPLSHSMTCDIVLRDVEPADAESFFRTPDRNHQSTGNRALLVADLIRLALHYGAAKDW